jgi:hypothetical protein
LGRERRWALLGRERRWGGRCGLCRALGFRGAWQAFFAMRQGYTTHDKVLFHLFI